MFLDHMIGDEVRIGDDRVAPRHAGIVKSFEGGFRAVGPVIGGHHGNAGKPGRGEGAPGGGARTHMDHIRPDHLNKLGQP